MLQSDSVPPSTMPVTTARTVSCGEVKSTGTGWSSMDAPVGVEDAGAGGVRAAGWVIRGAPLGEGPATTSLRGPVKVRGRSEIEPGRRARGRRAGNADRSPAPGAAVGWSL